MTAAVVEDARTGRAFRAPRRLRAIDHAGAWTSSAPSARPRRTPCVTWRKGSPIETSSPSACSCAALGLGGEEHLTDNWIYIQEPDVQVGRLQIFNNWSPYMVRDPRTVMGGARVLLLGRRRRCGADRTRRSARSRRASCSASPIIGAADVLGRRRRARSASLSRLLRRVRSLRAHARLGWIASRTSSCSAATACIATTTRTTRCLRAMVAVDNLVGRGHRQGCHLGGQHRDRTTTRSAEAAPVGSTWARG